MPLQLPAMLPPIMSIGHQTNTLGAKPPMYKLAVMLGSKRWEGGKGDGEPMELRHSDVGRTGRQSNKGTLGDTLAFLFLVVRGAMKLRSGGAMSLHAFVTFGFGSAENVLLRSLRSSPTRRGAATELCISCPSLLFT